MMKLKSKAEKRAVDKKRKRKTEKNVDVETDSILNAEVDNGMQVGKEKREKSSTNRKRKNKDKSLVGLKSRKGEVDLEENSDGIVHNHPFEAQEIKDTKEHRDADTGAAIKSRKKKSKKKRKTEDSFVNEVENSKKGGDPDQDEIYVISSGDEDFSKGMRKWIMEYHQSRPGLNVLQEQIDEFITAHEEKLEEERKEREERAAEGGWTVVVHHKGRKKTTDAESGVAVGSVAQAAVENKMAKKKNKEVRGDFYRFQKKEAQRNEIMMLQSKFEEDKKRLQQLRAARKFRPY
ncbi:hypothetical protein PIB30_017511 [Stylosanthes scabra]|uniref:Ribosomal RNA-processing protein 7 C-terminal domain-containing protein n=1 Tax=Stylosanthes scabra TaxID=79078 RepID=A0ABU6R7X2_9FABA|nr:hypothetical protein [Stylosanthes scabra]